MKLADTAFNIDEFMLFLQTVQQDSIPDNVAKQMIITYLETWKPMNEIIAESKKSQNISIDIDGIIQEVICENQKVVDEYKA